MGTEGRGIPVVGMNLEVARYALRTFSLHQGSIIRFDDGRTTMRHVEPLLSSITGAWSTQPTPWIDGTCTAQCLANSVAMGWRIQVYGEPPRPEPEPGHTAPHEHCTCGIYGSLALSYLQVQYDDTTRIVAVIAAEGQTIIGSRGLRTQHARVVAWWSGDEVVAEIATRQFKDAKRYQTVDAMLNDYQLPAKSDIPSKPTLSSPQWWNNNG
jgi:hypothetical protein